MCASIGTRRGCPWTNGSPVNSHQSSGSRTSARNDQPSADTEATATSGLVGVAPAASVGNNEGQQARHNRNSSSAGTLPSPLPLGAVNCSGMWARSRSGMWPLGAPVAQSQKGSVSGAFARDCAPHPGERVSSIRDSLPQAAGPPRLAQCADANSSPRVSYSSPQPISRWSTWSPPS